MVSAVSGVNDGKAQRTSEKITMDCEFATDTVSFESSKSSCQTLHERLPECNEDIFVQLYICDKISIRPAQFFQRCEPNCSKNVYTTTYVCNTKIFIRL